MLADSDVAEQPRVLTSVTVQVSFVIYHKLGFSGSVTSEDIWYMMKKTRVPSYLDYNVLMWNAFFSVFLKKR